ncbi:aminotransferase [Paenibacillus tengchongensis]|uniref:aminotransferase n=1 Tax=Paenibacillus tengchongensis TaxID=2608684 RepID=UPI00124EBEDC|nr:aminotransferase [Paenibacillus tengchongensis]
MSIGDKQLELIEKDKNYLWHALYKDSGNQSPMIAASGEGSWFYDTEGHRYFDGVSGLWCLNLGHGRREIVEAAAEQMMKLSYSPLTLSHEPAIELSAKISELLGGGNYKTFFSNSGSEANETAFKIARQYHAQNGNPGKYKFISRFRAYHGSTLGALSATAQANRRFHYDPPAPGFLHVEPPYRYRSMFGDTADADMKAADMLEQTIIWEGAGTIAAVIMEPFISGGGVIIPTDGYLQRVAEICKKYDVLLIMDEVVSGYGRTGKMFGFMHFEGVQPDIITMAKGLTSGYLPLGATSVKEEIYDKFKGTGPNQSFRHVSTYGGHPASCAVARKNIEIIERENIVSRVDHYGQQILGRLHKLISHPNVGEVRGVGFLYGIELVENKETKMPISEAVMSQVIAACKQKGIIIGRNGETVPGFSNVLIIAPPLSSAEDDLVFLINTIKEAIYSL